MLAASLTTTHCTMGKYIVAFYPGDLGTFTALIEKICQRSTFKNKHVGFIGRRSSTGG